MTMGQIIKALRRERDMTQEELAQRLGVTYQAISKWENDAGMPDISQVVPLASVFNVSTDGLFGIAGTSPAEEAWKIILRADEAVKYGEPESYRQAYDILTEGLKKYPTNLALMHHAMRMGLALSMPENGYVCDTAQAKRIRSETICHASFIIANSKSISDVLNARQNLVFLYSANGEYDLATKEAQEFPVRADLTLYSNMAIVSEYMGNYERAATYLCSNLDYTLQALEDHTARLGNAYYNSGKYHDAIAVYESFFAILNVIFKDGCPPPYHDFDSGDLYLLLVRAHLALGHREDAMTALERDITYYLSLYAICPDDGLTHQQLTRAPLLQQSELPLTIDKQTIKQRLREKMSAEEIQPLRDEMRFSKLSAMIQAL